MTELPRDKVSEGLLTSPLNVLRGAIRAVPAVKYALCIAGIVSVVAIVKSFGIDSRLGALSAIVMLVLMAVLVVFARLAKTPADQFVMPVLVLVWFSLLITICTAAGLFGSVFFRWPADLQQWLVGSQTHKIPVQVTI